VRDPGLGSREHAVATEADREPRFAVRALERSPHGVLELRVVPPALVDDRVDHLPAALGLLLLLLEDRHLLHEPEPVVEVERAGDRERRVPAHRVPGDARDLVLLHRRGAVEHRHEPDQRRGVRGREVRRGNETRCAVELGERGEAALLPQLVGATHPRVILRQGRERLLRVGAAAGAEDRRALQARSPRAAATISSSPTSTAAVADPSGT
jgi:hypothetical protein